MGRRERPERTDQAVGVAPHSAERLAAQRRRLDAYVHVWEAVARTALSFGPPLAQSGRLGEARAAGDGPGALDADLDREPRRSDEQGAGPGTI